MGLIQATSKFDQTSFGSLISSPDAFVTGIQTFPNMIRSAKIAGEMCSPHEVIKHFPDISDTVFEIHQIRGHWQKY